MEHYKVTIYPRGFQLCYIQTFPSIQHKMNFQTESSFYSHGKNFFFAVVNTSQNYRPVFLGSHYGYLYDHEVCFIDCLRN